MGKTLKMLFSPASMALAVLAVSFIYTTGTAPKLPLCMFNNLTNRPCPGCGMTRAFLSISHGEPLLALRFNAFSWLMYGLFVWLVLRPVALRFAPTRGLIEKVNAHPWYCRAKRYIVPAFVASFILWGVWRMIYAPQLPLS